MIYPQKLSSKKSETLINTLMLSTIIISSILILINKITSPDIPWSAIANVGIIYVWITVIYSIKRNTNIASHVLLQMIAISLVLLYIDKKLSFYGWSIYIGIPIILMIANVTMLVLAIVSYRNYTKYAIYQLIIVIISMFPAMLVWKGVIEFKILNIISLGISVLNFVISLLLSYKEFYKSLKCNFHI